jgi:hypothetical protein
MGDLNEEDLRRTVDHALARVDIKPGQLKSVVQAAFCSGTTAVSPILWPPGHG